MILSHCDPKWDDYFRSLDNGESEQHLMRATAALVNVLLRTRQFLTGKNAGAPDPGSSFDPSRYLTAMPINTKQHVHWTVL